MSGTRQDVATDATPSLRSSDQPVASREPGPVKPAPGPNAKESTSGWRVFSGVMLLIVGAFNLIDGIVALSDAHYYSQVTGHYSLLVTSNLKTWGWVAVAFGGLMILTALITLFRGSLWSRVVGICFAGMNMVFQLAYLAHYPLWSFTMIFVDIAVIYGFIVRTETSSAQTV